MLAFGIRYLNGFVAASEPDSHDRPEWPPHPGRVFMALAAAHFETGAVSSERAALEWLQCLGIAPCIYAAGAEARALVAHYVPVNDRAGPAKAILQSAPVLTRDRQARTFARAWLENEVAYLCWPSAEPPTAIRDAFETLCGKVTRIGHSASLVQMWMAKESEVPPPTWVPDRDRAEVHLRVAGKATLEDFERRYNGGEIAEWGELKVRAADGSDTKAQKVAKKKLKEKFPDPPIRRRPELRLYEGYARPRPANEQSIAEGSVFGPHFVVRTLERESGPFQELDLPCAPQVVQRWRDAILTQVNDMPDSVRQLLSGHDRDGGPLDGPHLAFAPLAFVGHPRADGHLLGMGLVLPEAIGSEQRRHALHAIGRVDRLVLGRLGVWRIGSVLAAEPPWNLRPEVWTAHPGGATHWSTVTPIAFDRHPKTTDRATYQGEVAEMVAQACVRIGLPRPKQVIVTSVSAHLGVPPAHAFPRLQRKDGGRRRHAHAILVFAKPVRGPILIGAGRFRGYGVCRAMNTSSPR